VAYLEVAPRSQWRDRAGFPPASHRAVARASAEVPPPLRPPRDAIFDSTALCPETAGGATPGATALRGLHFGRGPVGWARMAVALVVALSFMTSAGSGHPGPVALDEELRLVAAGRVETFLPPKWEFRPLPGAEGHRRGLQASEMALGMIPTDLRHPSLEAYWVDATEVGVPSDYYRLAARGPIQDLLRAPGCQQDGRLVARSPTDLVHSGQYVAAVTGRCSVWSGPVRWASFVAAPGFGPVRSLGIHRSGLYVVRASVSEGPDAEQRLRTLLNGVSFGGTSVGEFLTAAGLPPKLP
jgi:hypothetical protein